MKRFNKLALCAGVAELADAQDLGSCGRKAVGVQIPPSAPKFPACGFCLDKAQRSIGVSGSTGGVRSVPWNETYETY